MRTIETQWWYIDLPEEWDASQEEETVIIEDVDGVGEIAITTLEKEEGAVELADLVPFIADVENNYGEGEHIMLVGAEGFYFHYQDAGEAVREWYLCIDNLIMLVTYCCDEENAGMDDSIINEILDTLVFKDSEAGR